MPKPGWGAIVQGEPFDLEDWRHALKESFEPWIEMHGTNTVLRSYSFDELTSADDVRSRAVALIERLNGAFALSRHANQLRFAGVVRVGSGGGIEQHVLSGESVLAGRSRMSPVEVTQIGPDGKPIPPPPPQPSDVQKWCTLAEGDDLLDDAFIYFGRGRNWFDIYKTLECLILMRFSDNENAFFSSGWAPEAQLRRLKRTANWARHAKHKFSPPSDPMSIDEAYELLAQLMRRALS